MIDLPRNLVLDLRTVTSMVHLYCEGVHRSRHGALCDHCGALVQYAAKRLEKCPFGCEETTCRDCPVHCYRAEERAAMKTVMRYAGPRMLWRHPLLAVRHLWLERKGAPPWPPLKSQGRGSADPRPVSERR